MSAQAGDPARLRVVSAGGAAVADLPVEGVAPAWIDPSTIVCGVFRAGPAGSMDRSDLVAVSLPGGQVRPLVTTASGEILFEPSWHPSGGLVALLVVVDATTGAEVTRLVHASAVDVQGVISGGPALSASALPEIAPGHLWPSGPAWSPDGTRLAFAAARPSATVGTDGLPVHQSDIAVLTLASGSVQWITDDTHAPYSRGILDGSPSFSPDGTWLAWARGHEDDENRENRIVMTRLGDRRPPRVLSDDRDWWRWGLHW